MSHFRPPPKGWLRFMRETRGLTGEELGLRLGGMKRSGISKRESSEVAGSISLADLRQTADALECELVYYLVPRKPSRRRLRELIEGLVRVRRKLAAVDQRLDNRRDRVKEALEQATCPGHALKGEG